MTRETDSLSAESAPTMTASMASRMCCMLGRRFESAWRHVDSVAHSDGGHCVEAMCAWLAHGWLLSNRTNIVDAPWRAPCGVWVLPPAWLATGPSCAGTGPPGVCCRPRISPNTACRRAV
jgi:hypothetical protein